MANTEVSTALVRDTRVFYDQVTGQILSTPPTANGQDVAVWPVAAERFRAQWQALTTEQQTDALRRAFGENSNVEIPIIDYISKAAFAQYAADVFATISRAMDHAISSDKSEIYQAGKQLLLAAIQAAYPDVRTSRVYDILTDCWMDIHYCVSYVRNYPVSRAYSDGDDDE